MNKKTKHKIIYRVIAYLLAASMLIGITPIQASAADCGIRLNGKGAFTKASINDNADETADGLTDDNMENNAIGSTDENTDDSTDTSNDDNASGTADGSIDDNTNDTPGASTDDRENDTGGTSTDDSENDNDDTSTDDSENDDDDTSVDDNTDDTTDAATDEDTDEITEEPDEEAIEENEEELSDEESVQAETDISDAESAFEEIASEKDLMALIYLTDVYHVRNQADEESSVVAKLESGHTVYPHSVVITNTQIWYKVQFWLNGAEMEGYVLQKYLAYSDEDWLAWEKEYLNPLASAKKINRTAINGISSYSASYADIEQFPAGYQSALTELKTAHPNWTFVPMITNLDFNTAVSKEMGAKSLIQATTSNVSKGWVGEACPTESGWYYATKDAVAYCMDPRNFLTETYIFQFEQLTFNASYHTTAAVQSFLNSTFMKGTLSDDSKKRTYAEAFYEIGSARKLSPIHLASRVYQEQGQGTSGLISGTYPGYEGYYNYFNVGVNGSSTDEKIRKGLTYAKEKGWNTRYKSLEGGAATIGNNYILKSQDTIYLEKFNVDANSPYGLYEHQYMQNIQAPASESSTTKKMYSNAGSLNSAFVFKIPVYNNMPGVKLDKTKATMNKGEDLTLTASINGTALKGNEVTWRISDTSGTSDAPVITMSAATEAAETAEATITAAGTGTAVVTASYEGHEASCTITVVNPLQKITLDKQEIILRRPDTIVEDTENLSEEEKSANTSTATLQVFFEPDDTTDDKTITWTSSNNKVATVKDGVVTAVGSGQATITAKASKAGNKTAACAVTVIAPIYKIEFSSQNNTNTLLVGQSTNLTAEYFPKDTTSDTNVVWSTSDASVATVDKNKGTVKGIGAGKATITAEAGGYRAAYEITVEACTVTFKDKNGGALKTLSVSYGETIAEEQLQEIQKLHFSDTANSDQSIFIGWYTGVNGTGSRFDSETKIYQKETIVYPHFAERGSGFYVIPIGDQLYTGSAIKPTIEVYDSISKEDGENDGKGRKLVLNQDYTVSYKNNKKPNEKGAALPTVTVKGKGNYSGTETVPFNIVKKSLTDSDIAFDHITAAYTGKTIKSNPVIYRNGKKLIKNTDYTVAYPQTGAGAYLKAGTYPIIITGKGGYSGTLTVYETITTAVLMSKVSIAKIPNQSYQDYESQILSGEGGIEPKLAVTYKKQPLSLSTDDGKNGDYTVKYSNNLAVGTATVTITAVEGSGFTGSKSVTFKITGTSISKAVINGVESKVYTGRKADAEQDREKLSVSLNGLELKLYYEDENDEAKKKTSDCVVSYLNTTKAGTATVVITGINKYTGTKKKTYKINACDLSQIGTSGASNISDIVYYDDVFYYTKSGTNSKEESSPAYKTVQSLQNIAVPYMKGGTKPVISSFRYQSMRLDDTALESNILSDDAIADNILKSAVLEEAVSRSIILEYGKDYTISYKNNNAVTTNDMEATKRPVMMIKGKGNYKGILTVPFTITNGNMADDNGKITMSAKDVVYKQKQGIYKTSVVLTDANGKKLQAGKDYDKTLHYTYVDKTVVTNPQGGSITRNAGETVQDTDIPDIGTAIRITVQGMGYYAREDVSAGQTEETPAASTGKTSAALSTIYHIVAADISKAKVRQINAKTYDNGKEIFLNVNEFSDENTTETKCDIEVTLNGQTLRPGIDYVVDNDTYVGNTKKGKASVVIKGTGQNYGGTKKINFTIGSKILAFFPLI